LSSRNYQTLETGKKRWQQGNVVGYYVPLTLPGPLPEGSFRNKE